MGEDKEDLLKQLVEEPLKGLISMIELHFSEEMSMESPFASIHNDSADIKAAKEIMHFMYQHYDALVDQMAGKFGIQRPDHYMVHWSSHIQIDSFIHLLTHERDEKKAVRHIEEIVVYLLAGWNNLFSLKG